MAYIKSIDDKHYVNHKFVNAFTVEKMQVTFRPYALFALMDNGSQIRLATYDTLLAANQEIERIINEAYIEKKMIVEVK